MSKQLYFIEEIREIIKGTIKESFVVEASSEKEAKLLVENRDNSIEYYDTNVDVTETEFVKLELK